ncbi:MAG: hypothetical protein QMB98_08475, partial [Flaviflexus sp.]|uniref:hypothetical protein n=1 Tax=Flaviflexus sp. TaxID=1969482 RepID=UPI00352CF813
MGTVLTSGAMPEAEMVMTPVSLFPILDDNYDLVDIERRELLSGQQTVYLDANGSPLAGKPTEVEEPTPADPIPSGNAFVLSNSWDSTTHDVAFAYGRIGDEVLVGDWDGNGADTLAVRRGTTFYVNNELRGG